MKTILSFGETLWDLLPTGPMLGGAPCNFAYRVHSLGDRGLLVTRLGRDDLGRKAADQLKKLGMDPAFVQWDDRRATGTVPVQIDAQGSPDFTILPDVAYDYIEPTEALLAEAARADAVCFGSLCQRSEASRRTLHAVLEASSGVAFLDINLRKDCFTPETLTHSLDRADILKLNEGEARYLAELFGIEAASLPAVGEALIRRASLSHCLITLGERGALGLTADEKVYVPGFAIRVVDACGSGDAFSAGFLHAHLQGRPLAEACALGNALGALVAMQAGATGPVAPSEIERFLAKPRERLAEPELRSLA